MNAKKNCEYHLVLVTKYRYRIFDAEVSEYIHKKLEEWSTKLGFEVLESSVEADHVHVFLKYTGSGIEDTVSKIKGRLAFSLHKRFQRLRRFNIWNDGYYLSTARDSKKIREYVKSQGFKESEVTERTFKLKVLPSKKKSAIMNTLIEGVQNNDSSKAPAAMLQRTSGLPQNSFKLRADLVNFKAIDCKLAGYALRVNGSKKASIKPFWLALQHRNLPKSFTLRDSYVLREENEFYACLVCQEERTINRFSPEKVISIDLGIKRPVTSVTLQDGKIKNINFWGKYLKRQVWLREKRRSTLQSASKEYGWEYNRRSTLKYQHRIEDALHKYSTALIKEAKKEGYSICVGHLCNVRSKSKKRYSKKGRSVNKANYNLHKLPFGKLKFMLEYKAKLYGVPLLFVDEAYTSQKCSSCGDTHPENRERRHFKCLQCNHHTDADLNAAINIADKASQLSGYDTALKRTGNPVL